MNATLTVLGSGTSMGVPTIGCTCAVCHSPDPRDRRTRPSVLVEYDGRSVLIISLTGLEESYGAVLVIVLHPSGRFPDTAMSVVIGDPIPCTAVAVNIQQLRVDRFEGAKLLGPVDAAAMARVDQALRAVQDL